MKAITIARIAVLMGLFAIAIFGLFGEPEDNALNWYLNFLISKIVAFAALYATIKLHDRWKKIDEWLKEYDEKCEEAMEKSPNPINYDKEVE